LRTLRQARGWTIEDLARRSHISASTISRLETGGRRLAVDQLVLLARALDTTVEELLVDEADEDVVIRPTRNEVNGATYWMLTPSNDT
jgi:transcriptional regulator with XRE-family HTH domain